MSVLALQQLRIATDSHTLLHIERLTIEPGELLGLVGESGSGKSLCAKAILGLLPNKLQVSGSMVFASEHWPLPQYQTHTAMAAIFQHPAGSFTPVIKIGKQIDEVLRLHRRLTAAQARRECVALLQQMGLGDCERVYNSFPQQLSGGMLQRAAIAMALACRPKLLIADEPTTALDSLTQLEVLDLLKSLQQHYGLSILLISHDLGLVAKYSDRIAVMQRGQLLEVGASQAVLLQPQHPYTQQLLRARPSLEKHYTVRDRLQLEEDVHG